MPGLFFCGASVLGGGVVPSALSGFMAATLALETRAGRPRPVG